MGSSPIASTRSTLMRSRFCVLATEQQRPARWPRPQTATMVGLRGGLARPVEEIKPRRYGHHP